MRLSVVVDETVQRPRHELLIIPPGEESIRAGDRHTTDVDLLGKRRVDIVVKRFVPSRSLDVEVTTGRHRLTVSVELHVVAADSTRGLLTATLDTNPLVWLLARLGRRFVLETARDGLHDILTAKVPISSAATTAPAPESHA